MLFLLFAWTVLGLISLLLGLRMLHALGVSNSLRGPHRLFIPVWIGLFSYGLLLLALSLFVPLQPIPSSLLIFVSALLSISHIQTRRDFAQLFGLLRMAHLGAAIAIAVPLGYYSTRPVPIYDTGLYHYPLIRWLAEYGSVKGLGLLHERFGFTSIWFPITAPFAHGPLETRAGTMIGAFSLFLCVLHILSVASDGSLRRPRIRSDIFLAGGLTAVAAYAHLTGLSTSPSPDFPVAILTVLVGWRLVVSPGASDQLTLLLASFAVAIKASAAPLLLVALVHYALNARRTRASLKPLSWPLVVGVLVMATTLLTTGCLAFPAASTCLQPAWGVTKELASDAAADIQEWARWGGPRPEGTPWFPYWLNRYRLDALILLTAVVGAPIMLLRAAVLRQHWMLPTAFLATAGAMFSFGTAPHPRFGFGYSGILSGFVLVGLVHALDYRHPAARRWLTPGYGVLAAMLAMLFSWDLTAPNHPELDVTARLVRPAPAHVHHAPDGLPLSTIDAEDFSYRVPQGGDDRCWAAPPPCANKRRIGIQLNDPANGLRSGFSRTLSPTI